MVENWKEIRLDSIYKKLSALETALLFVSNDLESWIEEENDGEKCIETIIFGQETVEGVVDLINDVKNDVMSLGKQIEENRTEKK
jgi:hypothetical protein